MPVVDMFIGITGPREQRRTFLDRACVLEDGQPACQPTETPDSHSRGAWLNPLEFFGDLGCRRVLVSAFRDGC